MKKLALSVLGIAALLIFVLVFFKVPLRNPEFQQRPGPRRPVAGAQTNSVQPNPLVRTISLGTVPATAAGGAPVVSGNNQHVAYPVIRRKCSMSLDGVEGKSYQKVGPPLFSPDGRTLAFVARKAFGQDVVVVNGEEGKEYGSVDADSLTFSPDSRRLAFIAGPTNSTKQFVVLDGTAGPEFDASCGAPGEALLLFSPDSELLAYSTGRKTGGDLWAFSVIVEGKERKVYSTKNNNKAIVKGFSPDNRNLAWLEDSGVGQNRIVIDGKAGEEYQEISRHFSFSPDSQRTAYFAMKAGKWLAVVNGREGPAFDSLGDCPPTFSPDGRRLAYVLIRGTKCSVMLDGKEGREYDGVRSNSLRFSPDGQHFAYLAWSGREREHFIVLDGQEGKHYEGARDGIFFSPDGKHLAYVAEERGKCLFIVDNIERNEFDGAANNWFCFSPDSAHLAYGGVRESKLVLVLDGREIGEYAGNLGTLAFDGPDMLRGVASQLDAKLDWEILRLDIELAPAARADHR